MRAEAHFHSPQSQSYFDRLIRHFAHKIQVSREDTRAQLVFSCGVVDLHVSEQRLTFLAQSEKAGDLSETCAILTDHMRRFAWREDKPDLLWHDLG